MKKPGADVALLSPALVGWRVSHGGTPALNLPTLAEAVAALPPASRIHLALPCTAVVIERITLPATDRAELAGMLQLQLEKTLPFPAEEVSSQFEIIGTGGNSSTVTSVAVHIAQLESLCQPLQEKGLVPEKITVFAMHVAALAPEKETVLAVYREQGQRVVAICENQKLGWAHALSGTAAEDFMEELPQVLLAAEMEGAPTRFAAILISNDSAALREPLGVFFNLPVHAISLEAPSAEPDANLLPPAWVSDARRRQRTGRLKRQAYLAVVAYLLLVAGAFAHLGWLKSKGRKIDAEFSAARPQLEFVKARQTRWNALSPAIEPSRFTVELLYLINRNLPADGLRITEFDQAMTQWKVVGEAPSANLAIDFVAKLKEEKELSAYRIEAGPPTLLPNDHAQFSIFGKQ